MGVTFQLLGSVFISQLSRRLDSPRERGRSHPLSGGRHCSPVAIKPLGLRGGRSLESHALAWERVELLGFILRIEESNNCNITYFFIIFGMNSSVCWNVRLS